MGLSMKLQQREELNAIRTLPVSGNHIDFSSNDYLGFAKSEVIYLQAQQIIAKNALNTNGATGSRLLTGNHNLYTEAEDTIAAFHKAECALLFNSGYDANSGFFSSVPQKGDVVLYDEYIHASIRDGLRLSHATAYKFRHNDVSHLQAILDKQHGRGGEIYIVVESVFSMDGDCSPMGEFITLAEKFGCRIIVDEAHALGVIGETGEGLVQHLGLENSIFARIMTFGKGLGCHGAAVLGSEELKCYLINFARSFIYTTGLPPHSVATILSAYKHLLRDGKCEVKKLKDIVSFFSDEVHSQNMSSYFINSNSAIHCAIVPGNEKVKNISSVLKAVGFDVKPILSPTVAKGKERVRICLHSYNTTDDITALLTALRKALLQ